MLSAHETDSGSPYMYTRCSIVEQPLRTQSAGFACMLAWPARHLAFARHDMSASSSAGSSKIAIVTGASAGIGRASAIALGRAGWTVVITGRDGTKLQETASQIERHHVVVGDLVCSNILH